jgi:integrase
MNAIPYALFQDRLLSLYKPPLRAPSTFYGMRSVLREFGSLPGVESTEDFTTHRVAEFACAKPARNVNTTISRLRYLKTASLFAHSEGWTDRPPQWARLMPRAAPPARERHLSYDQVVRLLGHLRAHAADSWKAHRLYALTATVAYTGLRKQEALHLQIGDLSPSQGLLRVVGRRRLKTVGSAAPVALPDELAAVLEAWRPLAGPTWLFPGVHRKGHWQGGLPGYRPLDRLKQAGDEAGIPGVGFHVLRHTWAKLAVARFGLSADQVRTNLRHTNPHTTEGYLHRGDPEGLRRIGRAIRFGA